MVGGGGGSSKVVKVGVELVEGVGCGIVIVDGSDSMSGSVVQWCTASSKELRVTGKVGCLVVGLSGYPCFAFMWEGFSLIGGLWGIVGDKDRNGGNGKELVI